MVTDRADVLAAAPDARFARSRMARRFAIFPVLFAGVFALTGLLGHPMTVLGTVGTIPVTLSYKSIPNPTIGEEKFLAATIRPRDGSDPTGLAVRLLINGAYASQAHASDTSGTLLFKIPRTFTTHAGNLKLSLVFGGSRLLAPAQTSGVLKVKPAIITVTSVPAVAGIPISVGNTTATTGPNGVATLVVQQTSSASQTALIAHVDQVTNPAIKVSFSRWGQGQDPYTEKQQIQVGGGDASYVLGLRTAYRASVTFVDQNNQPIDPTTITRARFTSSSGQELVLTDFSSSAWWEAGTAVVRTGGLQASPTLWRLAEVTMAGTNVVNSGQQAFTPTVNGTWTINLLLYDLTVRTNDALTGGAVGGTAELVYPDNTSKVLPLDAHGAADFPGLPRGSYLVRLKIGGIAPPTPIALSRSQEATIRVISNLDIAAAVGLGLLVLLVLLWIGRRRLRWMRRVAAVPVGVARRVPVPRSPQAARSAGAGTRDALAATAADVAGIGRGPGAKALRFGRDLVGGAARSIGRGISAAGRSASTAVRNRQPAGPRETGPSWPTPQPRPADAPMASATAGNRPVVSRVATTRPVTSSTAGSTWFDSSVEDEGPTHDCPRCGRAVPDSARFCRSCGHQQY